jgi:hypothetical protein
VGVCRLATFYLEISTVELKYIQYCEFVSGVQYAQIVNRVPSIDLGSGNVLCP